MHNELELPIATIAVPSARWLVASSAAALRRPLSVARTPMSRGVHAVNDSHQFCSQGQLAMSGTLRSLFSATSSPAIELISFRPTRTSVSYERRCTCSAAVRHASNGSTSSPACSRISAVSAGPGSGRQ